MLNMRMEKNYITLMYSVQILQMEGNNKLTWQDCHHCRLRWSRDMGAAGWHVSVSASALDEVGCTRPGRVHAGVTNLYLVGEGKGVDGRGWLTVGGPGLAFAPCWFSFDEWEAGRWW